uniref:Uncharacterized protein n=1 Tax=Eutreptiella gymnastica TaxID=73025 RepID=A0A7S1HX21_9EUGL
MAKAVQNSFQTIPIPYKFKKKLIRVLGGDPRPAPRGAVRMLEYMCTAICKNVRTHVCARTHTHTHARTHARLLSARRQGQGSGSGGQPSPQESLAFPDAAPLVLLSLPPLDAALNRHTHTRAHTHMPADIRSCEAKSWACIEEKTE